MLSQCTECDKFKGQCKCERPSFLLMSEKKDLKNLEKKVNQEKRREVKKVKGRIGPHYVESVLVDGKPCFLCNVNGKINLAEKIEFEEIVYRPLKKEECGYFPYMFEKLTVKLLGDNPPKKEELLDLLKKQIDNYIDICETDKHLILGDLLLSYCQEWIDTIHFLFFVGETESGKSTALHLFRWLGYRCLYGEDIPNADIYNFLGTDEEATGIICEDEAQDLKDYGEKIRTYKNSYSKGALKPRIIQTLNSKKQVYYKTFCLKLFAGEKVPEDKGFQERLAIVHMTEGLANGNIKRLSDDEKLALNVLRNKLLVWKIQNINSILEHNNSGLEKRDQELWEDFLSVTYGTKYYEYCKKVVDYYTTQRHQTIWFSLEARLFKIVLKRLKNFEINLENFWVHLTEKETGDPELDGELYKQTFYPSDFKAKITKNSISKLFTEKFQAVKRQRHEVSEEGKQHLRTLYVFDSKICHKLAKKYNVELLIDNPILSGGQGGLGGQ